MCAICTAIPMTFAMGTYTKAQWEKKHQEAIERGETPAQMTSPEVVGGVTIAVTAGLVLGAVVYHTLVAPTIAPL